MTLDEIAIVLRQVKPILGFDGEKLFRCLATLTDGTVLPCVVLQDSKNHIERALKRFEETRNDKTLHKSVGYRSIVTSFVCKGNRINDYDVKSLAPSPYSIPKERMEEINGETSMGWTEFTAIMDDGKSFCFGTGFHIMFFDMPEGYTADRIKKIIPAIRGEPRKHSTIYREKPHFDCYIKNLEKKLTDEKAI